jgi:hypothetical protein
MFLYIYHKCSTRGVKVVPGKTDGKFKASLQGVWHCDVAALHPRRLNSSATQLLAPVSQVQGIFVRISLYALIKIELTAYHCAMYFEFKRMEWRMFWHQVFFAVIIQFRQGELSNKALFCLSISAPPISLST